jgi:hypothetical protein
MQTRIDEIGADMYRLSIFAPEDAPPQGLTFNHFLITGDEPLLFHCGKRKMFPLVSAAVAPDHTTGAVALACFRTF